MTRRRYSDVSFVSWPQLQLHSTEAYSSSVFLSNHLATYYDTGTIAFFSWFAVAPFLSYVIVCTCTSFYMEFLGWG